MQNVRINNIWSSSPRSEQKSNFPILKRNANTRREERIIRGHDVNDLSIFLTLTFEALSCLCHIDTCRLLSHSRLSDLRSPSAVAHRNTQKYTKKSAFASSYIFVFLYEFIELGSVELSKKRRRKAHKGERNVIKVGAELTRLVFSCIF